LKEHTLSSIQERIQSKLQNQLNPIWLSVANESHFHHQPISNKAPETHFKIEIVSSSFENLSLLKRHRLVNEIIKSELEEIKASSLFAFSPKEWEIRKGEKLVSPRCVKS
jgi:stress-induced morphogen